MSCSNKAELKPNNIVVTHIHKKMVLPGFVFRSAANANIAVIDAILPKAVNVPKAVDLRNM